MDCHGNSGAAGTTLDPEMNAHGSNTAPLLSKATMFELCAKCHGSAATTNWGKNITLEFNPANKSFHPVKAALNSTGSGSSLLSSAQLSGGWTPGRTMTCKDCHDTDSATGAKGPHGSAVKWMLAGNNKAWPYTSVSNNGTSSGTFRTLNSRTTGQGTTNGLFCLNCHTVNTSNHVHGENGDHQTMPCVGCHIRVPHGGKVSRLMNATNSATPLTILPARYAPDGNGGGTVYLRKFTRAANANSYSKSNCYSTASACNDHKGVIPAKAGIQSFCSGFRVKPGMTNSIVILALLVIFSIGVTGVSYAQECEITTCGRCHGYPPVDADGGVRNNPPGAVAGSHEKHVNVVGLSCTVCHANNTALNHKNGTIEMAAPIAGGSYSKGVAFAQVTNPVLGQCVSTNCHGSGNPTWGSDPLGCDSCHGYPPITKHAPGAAPVDHSGAGLLANHEECVICHGTKDDGTGNHTPHPNYSTATMHAKGGITMNSTAQYNETNYGCDAACHLNDSAH
ncbi:MAG: hypothetical protein HZC44_00160, partial [Geobacter sp.]|nr:hypothetical protein [Geobacter sp.]